MLLQRFSRNVGALTLGMIAGNLAALELMDETSIGDTALGVTFESYAARATKLHEALFYADMLHQGPVGN